MSEENKALVRKWYEISTNHDLSRITEVCAADYIHHDPNLPVQHADLATWQQLITGFIAALPDLTATPEDMVAEGDRVAVRWTIAGTHNGEMPGDPSIPPSGNPVKVNAFATHRIANGKIAETWVNFDIMTMLQQMGAIPAPG